VTDDGLGAFLAQEQLPDRFRLTVERVCEPLAAKAAQLRAGLGRTAIVGLCGAQGSGKSTVAAVTVQLLAAAGLRAVSLSLDDFYLSRAARTRLARTVHPLLAVRGPPGTHDVAAACEALDALDRPGAIRLPAFDKAADEPRPPEEWRTVQGPVDVGIFEGWCLGAVAQSQDQLASPVNALEAIEDPDGRWRRYVNAQLAEAYPALFGRLDHLTLLAAPGFEAVRGWRTEQERKLRARTGQGMGDNEVARFIRHYERLTGWILEEMPARADWTVRLDVDRTPIPSTP
jgi:D-glycerate 3-kinase